MQEQNKLSPQQALEIVAQVCVRTQTDYNSHVQMQTALSVLANLIDVTNKVKTEKPQTKAKA